jgi:hypothetical protein
MALRRDSSEQFDPSLWGEGQGQSSEQIVMRESFDYWLQIECPNCSSNRTYAIEDKDGQIVMVMCAACQRVSNRRTEEGGGGWVDMGLTSPKILDVIEMVEERGLSNDPYRGRGSSKEASSPINVVEVDDRTTEFGAVYGRRPLIYMPETMTLYVGQEGFHHQDVINGMPRLTADGTPIEDADHAIAEGELHDMGNNEAVFHVGGFGGVRGYEPSLQEVEALRTALSDLTGMDVDTQEGWRARTGSIKMAVPAPMDWQEQVTPRHYNREQPGQTPQYGYHGTSRARADRILKEGLKPWDSPDVAQVHGSPYESDYYEPRPGHTYLALDPVIAQGATHSIDDDWEGGATLLRIDLSKLDPNLINPDEDGHPQAGDYENWEAAWEDGEPKWRTLGIWAEDTGFGDDPQETVDQLNSYSSLAYRGVVPPEAISEVGGVEGGMWPDLTRMANTIFTCPECGSINGLESEGVDYCIDCQAAYSSDGKTPLTPEEVDDVELLKLKRDARPPRPTSSWGGLARDVVDSWKNKAEERRTGIPTDLKGVVLPCPQCQSINTTPQRLGQTHFCNDCEYAWDVNTQEPVELTPEQLEHQRWYKDTVADGRKLAMPLSPDSPGLPEFFYHVSPQENRDKILSEGLVPNAPSAWKDLRAEVEPESIAKTPDGVYLYDHLGNARAYASKMSGNGLPDGMEPMSKIGWDIYEIPSSAVQGAVIDPEMTQRQGYGYNYDNAMAIVKGQWDHLGPDMPVVQGHRYYTETPISPESLRIAESMPLVGPEEHEQYQREMQYVPTPLTMVNDLTNSPLADPEWNWDKHGKPPPKSSGYDKDGFKIEKVGANKEVWAYTKPQPEVKGHNTNPQLEGKAKEAAEFDPAVWGVETPADPNQMSIAGTCPDCGGNVEIEREERGHSDYIAGIPYDYYNVTCVGSDDPENLGWQHDGCGWSAYTGEKGGVQDAQIQNMIDANGHPPIDYDWAMEELVTQDSGRYGDEKSFDSDDADTLFNIAQSRGELDRLTAAFWRWVESVDNEILELEDLNWEHLRPDPHYEGHEQYFNEDGDVDDDAMDAWYESNDYRWAYEELFRNYAPSEAITYMRKLLVPETQT